MKFATCCLILLCIGVGCNGSGKLSLSDGSIRDASGQITIGGSVGVLRLSPGDCFLLGSDEIEAVDAVPCAESHQAEVFAVFDLADTEWPGSASIEQIAKSGCLDRFQNATGHLFDPVRMTITGYAPSEQSWKDDRRVLCVVAAPDFGLVRGQATLRSG